MSTASFSMPAANGRMPPTGRQLEAPGPALSKAAQVALLIWDDAANEPLLQTLHTCSSAGRPEHDQHIRAAAEVVELKRPIDSNLPSQPSQDHPSSQQTQPSASRKSFGPIPLAAFCHGQELLCGGAGGFKNDSRHRAYLMIMPDVIEVYTDAACSNRAHVVSKGDISKLEVTSKKFNVPGGIKFALKSEIQTADLSPSFSDDCLPIWISLRFAPFADPDWTLEKQDEVLAHMPRSLGLAAEFISPSALDSFIAGCVSVKQEDSRQRTAQDQAGAMNPERHSVFSLPWSGDSGEARPSVHAQSSSAHRAPEDKAPVDKSNKRGLTGARSQQQVPSNTNTAKEQENKENLEKIILVWPRGRPGAIGISLGDLHRLTPGEFLNDTIIEFGLAHLLHNLRASRNPIADDIHIFSSFFFKKLNVENFEDGYREVRKWTNKINIFEKKYIMVPINENIHWYLAIVYRPEYMLRPRSRKVDAHPGVGLNDAMNRSYIFTFDSLGGKHPNTIKYLQDYLAAEAEDKLRIPRAQTGVPVGKKAVVPTQPNWCDCGIYLLHFAETFIVDQERITRAILAPGEASQDDKNVLWQSHKVPGMRGQLRTIILALSDEWKEQVARAGREGLQEPEQDDADEVICTEPAVLLQNSITN